MLVQNLPLTVLKITRKNGVGKSSGKPYDFLVASVVDEDANVFTFNLSDEATEAVKPSMDKLRNAPVLATVRFLPKGFDIGGQIVAFEHTK